LNDSDKYERKEYLKGMKVICEYENGTESSEEKKM
jgi:hypothetical protein